ncbi:MAG: PLP-dependent aminotransferase family protein [Elsteraceae bacterium]
MPAQNKTGEISWKPKIRKAEGPVYLAIADALSADVQSGQLAPGARLPPQRALAEALGIDFTTVSRGYAEARKRGLVEGRVGQGTYVRGRRSEGARTETGGLVDMSMNLPPRFEDPALEDRMWDGIEGLRRRDGLDLLLRYQEPGGAARDRAAGANWLQARSPGVTPDRLLVSPGAQGALLAIVSLLAPTGSTICAEFLAYPGLRSLAAHLKLQLIGVPLDVDGPIPEAFDEICAVHRPRAFYCNPTQHNPTTRTIPLARREALIRVARQRQVPIIEDDAYGFLPLKSPPAFAALAPDLVYYIAGLAKCLAPALRIAYVAAPDARVAARVAAAIRATAATASPLTAAIASCWIEEGVAGRILSAIRRETAARTAIAADILRGQTMLNDPESFHLWLTLPAPWTRAEFAARLRVSGVGVVTSDAFALGAPPEAVRIGLGASENREALRKSLEVLVDLLAQSPAEASTIV